MHLAYPLRSPREDVIARIQRDETRDIGDNRIEVENHVAAVALLHPTAIEFHAKGDVLGVLQSADCLELPSGSRIIK